MALTEKQLKNIIREEISRLLEQDPLAGQTAFAGQARDPLAGQTAFAGQARDPLAGKTAFANAQGAVQALAGVKKQLAALSAEIDKVLASIK